MNELDLISTYTRADAIADGLLIEVTELARQAGFVYRVDVTRGAWESCVCIHDANSWQNETYRLWGVLLPLAALIRSGINLEFIPFEAHLLDGAKHAQKFPLRAHLDLGDDGEPVITISLSDED